MKTKPKRLEVCGRCLAVVARGAIVARTYAGLKICEPCAVWLDDRRRQPKQPPFPQRQGDSKR